MEGTPNVASNIAADIRSSKSGGNPLPLSVRRFMEPRFQADFSQIRTHSDENSARLNNSVRAKAFTVNNHVFFGRDAYQPDTDEGRELIAHELTHTIQQGAAVQRKATPEVTQRSDTKIHRLGISDALDYFAEHAHHIPGFRMFTIVLGANPINMSRVDRSAGNILRAVIEFLPGGGLITQALDNHGVFDDVSAWVEQQFNSLAMTGSVIRRAINRFLDSLSWRDIFDLGDVWRRAKRIFTEPIRRIISFGRRLVRGIIRFIKDAILRPLAQYASRTRGYDLLKAVLGRDPITGETVPRTPATLIGGFMSLIGQEEVWNNLQRANAVPRAWAWFQGALAGLMGFVRQIPTMFINAFRALSISDIILIPRAFARIVGVFAGLAGRFFSWAGAQVMQLLQIIFEVVAPGAMPFIRRAGGAFRSIVRNPIGFVRNLVRAGQAGLRAFATNFLTHLRTSLIGWLTGAMSGAGVYVPQAFTVREILKFILSVLGLTWQNIRTKLVRVVGERAVSAMESGFELVRTLVTEGPAAAWQKIVEGIQNLRELVIEQIMSFVQSRIVQAAITRLVSMLSPAGAFIQAIIATYNTIMFFVERMRTIMQVAMSFVNSIAAIAAGRIQAAAARVERTMAGMLTLVISFLARIAGLGRVADAVTNIINRVREPIDRALDRIVAWIVAQARRLGRFVAQAGLPQDPEERLQLGLRAAISAINRLPGNRVGRALVTPLMGAIRARYGFESLEPFVQNGRWWVRGRINPESELDSSKEEGETDGEDWPAAVVQGTHIRVPETRYVETVESVNEKESLDHTTHKADSRRFKVFDRNLTKRFSAFMALWNSRQVRLASSAGAEEKRAELVALYGSSVADAIMQRPRLRDSLGITDKREAHHLIPVEILKKQGMMRLLVESRWDFNSRVNAVALERGFHGNHPNYTLYVSAKIEGWVNRNGSSDTNAFKTYVNSSMLQDLRSKIGQAETSGQSLNDYFAQFV